MQIYETFEISEWEQEVVKETLAILLILEKTKRKFDKWKEIRYCELYLEAF